MYEPAVSLIFVKLTSDPVRQDGSPYIILVIEICHLQKASKDEQTRFGGKGSHRVLRCIGCQSLAVSRFITPIQAETYQLRRFNRFLQVYNCVHPIAYMQSRCFGPMDKTQSMMSHQAVMTSLVRNMKHNNFEGC